MATITLTVDPELAEKYAAAPQKSRDWFEYQTMLRMRTMLYGRPRSLRAIMDECGRQARENGMTPEIYEEIVGEKPVC